MSRLQSIKRACKQKWKHKLDILADGTGDNRQQIGVFFSSALVIIVIISNWGIYEQAHFMFYRLHVKIALCDMQPPINNATTYTYLMMSHPTGPLLPPVHHVYM